MDKPVNNSPLTGFVSQLRDAAQCRRTETAVDVEAERAAFKEASTPLVERLQRLLATIPESECQQPRPLEWFRIRLKGREGRGARADDVSNALRTLGWRRERCWRNDTDGFRALWYPPADGN